MTEGTDHGFDDPKKQADYESRMRRAREAKAKAKIKAEAKAELIAQVWADDIDLAIDRPGLIDGLLGTTGLTVVYGESGVGKTFVAVDVACHVAAGIPWNALTVERGVVVYVAAESPKSVERRVWAWKVRHGVEHLDVVIVQAGVDLLNGSVDQLIALIERIKATRGPVALVVVDTLARAMTGNENASDDMGRFVSACGRIREACGGHVIVVHHCGKDQAKGARGHSSLRAATDVEMEVTPGAVTVKKSRDGEDGLRFGFRLEVVELGQNRNGRTVTTCVADECEAAARDAKVAKAAPRGRNQRTILQALHAAVCDRGHTGPMERDIPRGARGVTFDEWREAAFRYMADHEPGMPAKRKGEAFARAVDKLIDEQFVRYVNGFVWLPDDADDGRKGRKGRNSAFATAGTHRAPNGHAGTPEGSEYDGCSDEPAEEEGGPLGGKNGQPLGQKGHLQ